MALKTNTAYNFFYPNMFLFTLSGMWSPYFSDPDTSPRKQMYKRYHQVILFLSLAFIVQMFYAFYRVYHELSLHEISDFYSFTIQMIVGLLKIYFLLKHELKTRKLFQEIENTPFHRDDDPVFDSKLEKCTKTSRKILVLFWIPIFSVLTNKMIAVCLKSMGNRDLFHEVCRDYDANSNETYVRGNSRVDCSGYPKLEMPLPMWLPIATDKSPGNQIAIFYQMLNLINFASYIFNFDMYITYWMMYISFQFELMEYDLQTLRQKSVEQVVKTLGKLDEELIAKEMLKGIKRIITLHKDILRLFHQTKETLNLILLVQYFWISLLLCMLMILITQHHPKSSEFSMAASYVFLAVIQIFVVFYYCNEVKVYSLKIPDAAFYCGWNLCGRHSHILRPYVQFLIGATNKELKVVAGGLFVIDLTAFLKVMKASYSFFALVNSSHKD